MRIDALHLIAYGPFDQRELVFPPENAFHIVYGPNEAGKSTALRAITAALYGIPGTQVDRWRFNDQIRAGLSLSATDDRLYFVRQKGRKNTLRDIDGKPLADEKLAAFLGAVDADTFRSMYGLTHQQLVEGGKAISDGKGDMGHALFAAGTGIANLRNVIATLQEDAAKLFKEGGSKPDINQAMRAFDDARKRVREYSVTTRAFEALEEAAKSAEADYNALQERRNALEQRLARNKHFQDALPLASERAEVAAQLLELGARRRLREDFSADYRTALQGQSAGERELAELARTIAELEARCAERPPDQPVLAQEQRLETLSQQYGHYLSGVQDLEHTLKPERDALARDLARARESIHTVAVLNEDTATRAPLPLRRRLSELITQWENLREDLEEARDGLKKHEARRAALTAEDHTSPPPDTGPLERRLQQARHDTSQDGECRRLRAELKQQRKSLDNLAARLLPGNPEWDFLVSTPLPSAASIDAFKRARSQWEQDHHSATQQCASARAACAQARSRLDELESSHDVVAPEDLHEARQARDTLLDEALDLWADGKKAEAAAKTEALRHSVAAADALVDRMFREVQQAEQLAQARRALHELEANSKQLDERLAALEAEAREQQEAAAALWSQWPLEPGTPADMVEWLKEQDTFAKGVVAYGEMEARHEALAETLAQRRGESLRLLEELGASLPADAESHDALLEALSAAHDRLATARAQYDERRKERERIEQDWLPAAQTLLDRKQEVQAAWSSEWTSCLQQLGLDDKAPPDEIKTVLDALDTAAERSDAIEDLDGRIQQIEAMIEDFQAKLRALATELDPTLLDSPPEQAFTTLWERLQRARQDTLVRQGLEDNLGREKKREQAARERLTQATARLEALCTEAGVGAVTDIPDAEEASRKRIVAETRKESIDAQLRLLAGAKGIEALLAELGETDLESLHLAQQEEERALEELQGALKAAEELRAQQRHALEMADTQGKAAEAALEMESQAAIIERKIGQYLRLKTAEGALGAAIERFQEQNEEPVLMGAEHYFTRLTLGSFARLRPDYQPDGRHTLLAEREDGARVSLDGLSDGSADQLYLALRLASLAQHFQHHQPIPFIADDLFINFDDDRASAGLQVLAEFSGQTQVIFFTHHQHLLDLAKDRLKPGSYTEHRL